MTALAGAIRAFEGAPLPDPLRRAAVSLLVARAGRAHSEGADDAAFAAAMAEWPIAEHADAANAQHYELPPGFFELILGPRLKYSCCLFPNGRESLAAAEELALAETCERAELVDGQEILELGCGWGSLSLWMAQRFPGARILAVSNSSSQRAYVEWRARASGVTNLEVVTCDMNEFQPGRAFDRIISVEMFEHMANWRALLTRARGWLKPQGRLFLHVFSHRYSAYRFEVDDPGDWIGRLFFSGGLMPSHGLIRQFDDLFDVEAEWRWSGVHYARTARAWLANYDRNARALAPILHEVYGAEGLLWRRRWRLFFLAVEGMFGHAAGSQWGVSHYRLRPA